MSAVVSMDRRGIKINDQYKVLLCASLFYFRIPAELWRDRIRRLKATGYNCVDVYFPWNYHEMAPGQWDFTGGRDAGIFLDMLSEEGIYVVARPGPYICSEWDGGGIPAWILASGMGIRENSQPFMGEVQKWYGRILPTIAAHQVGRGGSVILVQLDNELDFFDCPNPRSYMAGLADMARSHCVSVPLSGCAGQSDAAGATGFAEGVANTYNFYPSATDPNFDQKCKSIAKTLAAIDQPLLITETNREHALLRRELANGAKLLGAYNQVGGSNFGFTSSINNWGQGSPLSFISSDYDFHSMINAAGVYNEEALEARLLGGLIAALGERLAASIPEGGADITVESEFLTSTRGTGILQLHGGGWLVCVPNLTGEAGKAEIKRQDWSFSAEVGAYQSPLFPIDVPLDKTGMTGMIMYASAEILAMEPGKLLFYSDNQAEAMLQLAEGRTVRLDSSMGELIIEQDGKTCYAAIMSRADAARYQTSGHWDAKVAVLPVDILPMTHGRMKQYEPEWYQTQEHCDINMEARGLYRGFALYKAEVGAGQAVVVRGAADIITAYDGEERLDTRISGGQWQYYQAGGSHIRFIVESWGHSNFDDSRLDSLRLASPKGITALYSVLKEQRLEGQWRFVQMEEWLPERLTYEPSPLHAILDPNAWNSTRKPVITLYYAVVALVDGCTDLALRLEGNCAETAVYADGSLVCVVNPLDPWACIPASQLLGGQVRLELLCRKHDWSEKVGDVSLLHLMQLKTKVYGYGEKQLGSICADDGTEVDLPVKFSSSDMTILQFDMDQATGRCAYIRMEACDLKATAMFNGSVVGRIFGDGGNRPFITGGDSIRFYVPGPWYRKSGNKLMLFIEPTGNKPVLNSLSVEYAEL